MNKFKILEQYIKEFISLVPSVSSKMSYAQRPGWSSGFPRGPKGENNFVEKTIEDDAQQLAIDLEEKDNLLDNVDKETGE